MKIKEFRQIRDNTIRKNNPKYTQRLSQIGLFIMSKRIKTTKDMNSTVLLGLKGQQYAGYHEKVIRSRKHFPTIVQSYNL